MPHADRWIQAVAVADNGRRIYAGSFSADLGRGLRRRPEPRDHAVYALDQFGAVVWRDVCSHFEGVHSLASSRDGNTVAAGGWYSSDPWAGFVTAWTGSGMRLLTWTEAPSRIDEVALSADGTILVAVARAALYLFCRKPGLPFEPQPTAIVELGDAGFAGQLVMDDAGQWIAATDEQGAVILCERVGNSIAERRYRWSSSSESATRIALSANGDWLLAGTADGSLHMFNRPTFIATNRAVWTYPVVEAVAPTALAITADGSQIVAACERADGGSVYLLGNRDGAPHLQWAKQTKHTPTVAKINTQPGGEAKWIAVADADPRGTSGNFYLFETATGMIAGAHPCTAGCWALALNEPGSQLIGGSDEGSLYAFEVL